MDEGVWCRIGVEGAEGAELVQITLGGRRPPDLAVVDVLASVRLAVDRLGASLVVRSIEPELRSLLELSGLHDVLGDPGN